MLLVKMDVWIDNFAEGENVIQKFVAGGLLVHAQPSSIEIPDFISMKNVKIQ